MFSATSFSLYAQENTDVNIQTETIDTKDDKSENKKSEEKKEEKTQETEEEVEYESYFSLAKYERMDKYVNEFDHRLKFRMGVGLGQINPAILTETGSSWLINSALRSFNNPNFPIAIPTNNPKDLGTEPQYQEIAYGWKNQVDISWSRDLTLGRYDQGSAASVQFLTPRTENYWASIFEGNRLLRFEGVSEHFRLSYTYPLFSWFMIGPSINFHSYTEKNEISNGSYTTNRENNLAIWSIGGSASADYSMRGILPGILLKLQLKEWWEVRSRYEIIDRKGNFGILGAQLIQFGGDGAGTGTFTPVVPVYAGNVRDSGSLFMLETSFRYCRFTIDIGLIHQSVKRSYNSYLGDSVGNLNPNDYSAKTRGFGIGELGGSFRHTTTEIFIMPGVSFHFDEDGIY